MFAFLNVSKHVVKSVSQLECDILCSFFVTKNPEINANCYTICFLSAEGFLSFRAPSKTAD